MSLPSGISTCLVTFGRATSFVGSDATISGKLTADRAVVWEATGTRLMSGDDILPAENNESLAFSVPHVDQDGFVDAASVEPTTFWTYTLTATITLNGTAVTVTRDFQPLVGQTVLDLDLVADGETTPGVTSPQGVVTSISGLTGEVTFDEIRDGAGLDTGWRIIHSPTVPEFGAYITRVGNRVTMIMGADLTGIGSVPAAIPEGFIPSMPAIVSTVTLTAWETLDAMAIGYQISSDGDLSSVNISPNGFGDTGGVHLEWSTSDAFPAMPYPGTPA